MVHVCVANKISLHTSIRAAFKNKYTQKYATITEYNCNRGKLYCNYRYMNDQKKLRTILSIFCTTRLYTMYTERKSKTWQNSFDEECVLH